MSYDTTRSRLADAYVTAAADLQHGRILCLSLEQISYAFPSPIGTTGTSEDLLKALIPNAAFSFKYRLDGTKKHLLIERIVSDGVRRWVDPAQAAEFIKVGDAYFPANSRFGMIENG